jgi:superfamily II DNA or RNA helicase
MALDVARYFPRTPWDHQLQGLSEALEVLKTKSSVVMCAPCGAGKSTMISALMLMAQEKRRSAILYNFRTLLVSQMSETLSGHGVEFGVRSAAHKKMKDLSANIQVASIHTDIKRINDQGCWTHHDADLVIFDEAHMGTGPGAVQLMQHYLGAGAKVIGVTATPASLAHMYADIVIAGTKKQLRACKAHVPAKVFAPHQMDLDKVKRTKTGEFDLGGGVTKKIFNQAVVGKILEDWQRYNPDGRQTLHFTPGVSESEWAAEMFWSKGIPSGHIDSKKCWYNGKTYKVSQGSTVRQEMLDMWDDGRIVHMSNHSVLKEGIDRPSVYCLMLSRPIGNVCTYDQITGRLIRYSEATPDEVVMIDFASSYDRFGSPNSDRDWVELFNMSAEEIVAAERQKNEGAAEEDTPITCPQCGMKRLSGPKCPNCGHEGISRNRQIIQEDGTLREMPGVYNKPPPPKPPVSKEQKQWDSLFWRCRHSSRNITFAGVASIYRKEYGELPTNIKRIPATKDGWKMPVKQCDWKALK